MGRKQPLAYVYESRARVRENISTQPQETAHRSRLCAGSTAFGMRCTEEYPANRQHLTRTLKGASCAMQEAIRHASWLHGCERCHQPITIRFGAVRGSARRAAAAAVEQQVPRERSVCLTAWACS